MKKFLITIFILILVGVGIYFGITKLSTREEEPEVVVYPDEIVYVVNSVDRVDELPGDILSSDGDEFLVLSIYGENHDQIDRKYNVFYFTFIDEDGKKYENNINTKSNALTYGEIAPNTPISGTIVFEVPKGSSGVLDITDENFNSIQEIEVK